SLFSSNVWGMDGHYRFRHYNTENGLAQDTVTAIAQDSDGSVWFGTFDGLSRFDGYTFTNFQHSVIEPNGLPNGSIQSLLAQQNGEILVGTLQGISRYHPSSNTFSEIPVVYTDTASLRTYRIARLFQDSQLTTWMSLKDGGLFKYDDVEKQFVTVSTPQTATNSPIRITAFSEFDSQTLALGSHNGLYLYESSRHSFKRIPLVKSATTKAIKENHVLSISKISENRLMIGTLNGLFQFDAENETVTPIVFTDSLPTARLTKQAYLVEALLFDSQNNNLWIGTQSGLFLYDLAHQTSQHIVHVPAYRASLADNAVQSLFLDSFGTLWIGLANAGLNSSVISTAQFGLHYKMSIPDSCLSSSMHFNILKSRAGDLWIDSYGKGLHRISKDGTCQWFHNKAKKPYRINSNLSPGSLFEDSLGSIWHGSIRGSIYRYQINDQQTTRYTPQKMTSDQLRSGAVRDALEDENGNIWFAIDNGGIAYYDRINEQFVSYLHDPKNPNSLSSDYAFALALDKNTLWIGTETGGLDRFDLTNKTFTNYWFHDERTNGFKVGVSSLVNEKTSNFLWAGTQGEGLARVNKATGRIQYITTRNGLSNNFIYKVIRDNEGFIWVSTNYGLSRVNPTDLSVTRFTLADGLQGNEFSTGGYFDAFSHTLYFVGPHGFNQFNPSLIRLHHQKPQIKINHIKIFNEKIHHPLQSSNSVMTPLNLRYSENMLTLGYLGVHTHEAETLQYYYQLDGFDEKWYQHDSKNRETTYTNLNPGSYTFKVKAQNRHHIWSDAVSLPLEILPPWWLTWPFKILYSILLLTVPYLFYRYKMHQTMLKKRELEALVQQRTRELSVEKQRVEELLNNKSKEFESISHEFRTPLAIIIGRAQQQLSAPSEKNIKLAFDVIQAVAKRLALVVDNVIELGKIKHFEQENVPTTIPISSLLHEICVQMLAYANLKTQTFDFDIQPEIYQNGSAMMMEKVFNNLIANAIKYTDEKGHIQVSLKQYHVSQYEFSVTDNGIGIPDTAKTAIFDRFYRGDHTISPDIPGSGIGLALVKEVVDYYHGDLSFSSQEGKGTCFTLRFACTNPQTEAIKHQVNQDEIHALMALDSSSNDSSFPTTSYADKPHDDRASILIIEDNTAMNKLLMEQLGCEFQTFSAKNGQQGWELTKQFQPNVVISDINMPIVNGFELLEKIKHSPITSHIPVILLTAKKDVTSRITGFRQHADGYLAKPYDVDELMAMVNAIHHNRIRIQDNVKLALERGEALAQTDLDQHSRSVIERSIECIKHHYRDSAFNVKTLALQIHMSDRQISRKFQETVGCTPLEFINDYRLTVAKQLLIKGLKVNQVANEVGFNSGNYLSRLYKKKFGHTPSQASIQPENV
ncbi:MAG: two-component regulator propeller domain-containing protein, partial [Pseudomonadota bacterium]